VGQKPEEMYGRTDIENGWDPEQVLGNAQKGIRGYLEDDRNAFEGRPTFNRRDPATIGGVKHVFDTHKLPLRDTDGRIVGVFGMCRDVTELQRVSDRLRESEAHYRALVEDYPIMVGRYTIDFKVTFVNDVFCRFFQMTADKIIGKSFLTLIPESDHERIVRSISTLSVESPTISNEHKVISPNGEECWQHWTNRAVFDDQGKVVAYHAVGEDITRRKAIEKALKVAHEDLELKIAQRTTDLTKTNMSLREEIKERQRIESSLKESERLLDLISDAIEDVCWIIDLLLRHIRSEHFSFMFSRLFMEKTFSMCSDDRCLSSITGTTSVRE
jgi:PAS domain S-box-containing protein